MSDRDPLRLRKRPLSYTQFIYSYEQNLPILTKKERRLFYEIPDIKPLPANADAYDRAILFDNIFRLQWHLWHVFRKFYHMRYRQSWYQYAQWLHGRLLFLYNNISYV